MTTPDLNALAQRASVALATLERAERIRSRWLPGMMVRTLAGQGRRRMYAHAGGLFQMCGGGVWSDDGVGPDLSDPLTVQALFLLAQEAANDPLLVLSAEETYDYPPGGGPAESFVVWTVGSGAIGGRSWGQRGRPSGTSPAEALVNALETLAAEDSL